MALYGWLANDNQTLQNQVWIIDRGTDQNFTSLGLKKIQLVAYDEASFTMRYGNLNNTDTNTIKIYKNEFYCKWFLTFDVSNVCIGRNLIKVDYFIIFSGKVLWNQIQSH